MHSRPHHQEGHKKVVQMLLDQGAFDNAQGGRYCHIRKQIPPHILADCFPNPILKHASPNLVTSPRTPAKLYCIA
jgi:hypothetical protein